MSVRAGIVVTGTEVLTGRVTDRNGPWLADRLEELGVDLAEIVIVGDRREEVLGALRFLAGAGAGVILTTGGLGPTADDLTAEVVAEFQGRAMELDVELQGRIERIVAPLLKRWPNIDPDALRVGSRKQATVPVGATVLEPVGTAPGLVVTPGGGPAGGGPAGETGRQPRGESEPDGQARGGGNPGPTVVVLPGPPRELQPMWATALATDALKAALSAATVYRRRMLRLFGIPESEIAETLRDAEARGVDLGSLEITTCLRRGEVEVVTRYEPPAEAVYEAFAAVVRERHGDMLFSEDSSSVDVQVAALLRGDGTRAPLTIATAESCTGGLLAARLTELPGASEYVRGGIVAYSNDAKVSLVGVPAELIEQHGAVSPEVAQALAEGARAMLGADVGVGVTGVAGPAGGTPEKPVGLVCLSVVGPDGAAPLTRSVNLPGGRVDVRDRATTIALHLVRRSLVAVRRQS
jgi:nicotinamide-nucleotide amidase